MKKKYICLCCSVDLPCEIIIESEVNKIPEICPYGNQYNAKWKVKKTKDVTKESRES